MKEVVDKILEQVEADISEIDLYGYNIIGRAGQNG